MESQQYKPYYAFSTFDGIEEVCESPERSNQSLIDGGIVGLNEIEDVDSDRPIRQSNTVDGGEVKAGGIVEVLISSSKRANIINGGTISTWENSEASHKAKIRLVITTTTLALWATWTIIGLVTYSKTGNPFLLITSPSTVAGVPLYRILYRIVRFYF